MKQLLLSYEYKRSYKLVVRFELGTSCIVSRIGTTTPLSRQYKRSWLHSFRMRLKKEREARIAAEHNQRVLEQKLMVIEQEQQASKKGKVHKYSHNGCEPCLTKTYQHFDKMNWFIFSSIFLIMEGFLSKLIKPSPNIELSLLFNWICYTYARTY